MKKMSFSIFIFLSIMFFTVGCNSNQETDSTLLADGDFMPQTSAETADEVTSGGQNKDAESAENMISEEHNGTGKKEDQDNYPLNLMKPTRGIALTMELWIENLVPLEKPALEDYSGYTNAQWAEWSERSGGLLTYSLTDEMTGETYKLQISYNSDDHWQPRVVLWRDSDADMILVFAPDPKDSIYVNPNVRTFLNTKKDMSDYLSYELPAGMEKGTFYHYDGIRGGVVFLCEGKEIAPLGGPLAWPEWMAAGGVMIEKGEPVGRMEFTDGLLTGMPIIWNHSELLTQPEPLEDCAAPALLVKMDHDVIALPEINEAEEIGRPIPEKIQSARIWYVFFAREGSSEMYYVYLNADYYSCDDVKELARSVKFTENAFPE